MQRLSLLWRLFTSFLLIILFGTGLSCTTQPPAVPRVWIDIPKDGTEVKVGTTVSVVSHAYARNGVAEIMLSVNGEPYRREPPSEPGASFTQIGQEWVPEKPGEYILQVRAYDSKGQASNMAVVRVIVVGEVALAPTVTPTIPPLKPTLTFTPTPPPTPTPTFTPIPPLTPTPTFTPKPTATPTPTQKPTPTPTPTFTPTPIPPAQVNFWVERDTIASGECTVLHWDVEHATAVYLDGEGVVGHGTRQVCPASTTTYRLHVVAPAGDVDRSVTVVVTAPLDTTPPTIAKIAHSADPIYDKPACGPNSVTITAWVSDPSGVSRVELSYRVVRSPGPTYGQWRTLVMNPVGGDKYQATVGQNELQSSLNPPVYSTSTIEYYIRAWDTRNNVIQSGITTITLKACVI